MAWIAEQDWIDVVHVNIQDTPVPTGFAEGHRLVVASGKLVVNAAGNGVQGSGSAYPSFPMQYAPPGVLLAGANDNDGQRPYWANLYPHLVMDGVRTVAAEDLGFGRSRHGRDIELQPAGRLRRPGPRRRPQGARSRGTRPAPHAPGPPAAPGAGGGRSADGG